MRIIRRLFIIAIASCLLQVAGISQIRLPKIFSDHMVLQRGIKIPVWGKATPGAKLIARLGKERVTTMADSNGKWMLQFSAHKAGGPYLLTVTEAAKPETSVKFYDILIGDVWLASGQSNMEWEVQQAKDAKVEIAKANYPQIRFMVVSHHKAITPQEDILAGNWIICDTASVAKFSAVAYYFSRKIHIDQHVPVGIIQSTWGGTPVESWTSREQLLASPITKNRILDNDTLSEGAFIKDSMDQLRFWDIVYNPQLNTDKELPKVEYDDSAWPVVEMPKTIKDFEIGPYEGMMWMRRKITLPASFSGKDLQLHIGHPEMNYSIYFNGAALAKTVWNSGTRQSFNIPASLAVSGENVISFRIAMLWGGGGINSTADEIYITDGASKVSIAGKWFYQKDLEPAIPKLHNYHQYPAVLFNAMIHPVVPYAIKGVIWYQGENNTADASNYRELFPMLIKDWRQRWKQGDFPFLYVQLANFKKKLSNPSESDWAELREAQTMTLKLPNTAMACIIDIGDADNIHPANKQEVGRRLALHANKLVYKQELVTTGPVFKNMIIDGSRMHLSFDNVGTGLQTSNPQNITGFAIAGADKIFYGANACLEGTKVIVYSDKVPDPKALRYAWADNPDCSLFNSAGLPALPFRTDDWKGITQK